MKRIPVIVICIAAALLLFNGTCATTDEAKDPEQSGLMPTEEETSGEGVGEPAGAEETAADETPENDSAADTEQ